MEPKPGSRTGDTRPHYRELDIIEIPQDVPEIGVKAGETGTIVDMLGGSPLVEIVDEGTGKTRGMVHMSLQPHPHVTGVW